jgi:polyhydroxybutyrate depolymerase
VTAPYPLGVATADSLVHRGVTRTFRVYLPGSYDRSTPRPVVLNFHGGFGSGAQQEASARITEVANEAGFIAVSPDGVPDPVLGIRSWNGGGCCGYAMNSNVDDVGFVRALLDRLEVTACIDRRRVYAQGISNGAILSHRLACELADRIRAIGPVAGTDMTASCEPTRPVPVLEIHGSADPFVPYGGGLGCGPGGIAYASVPETIEGWRTRGGCSDKSVPGAPRPESTCDRFPGCAAGVDVEQCTVTNGGHVWPGGTAPLGSGIGGCAFGYQSQTFVASSELWNFFAAHPLRSAEP